MILKYSQVYPPGTFVAGVGAAQVEKVVVPWGWKRLLLNGTIVYFRLDSLMMSILIRIQMTCFDQKGTYRYGSDPGFFN